MRQTVKSLITYSLPCYSYGHHATTSIHRHFGNKWWTWKATRKLGRQWFCDLLFPNQSLFSMWHKTLWSSEVNYSSSSSISTFIKENWLCLRSSARNANITLFTCFLSYAFTIPCTINRDSSVWAVGVYLFFFFTRQMDILRYSNTSFILDHPFIHSWKQILKVSVVIFINICTQ